MAREILATVALLGMILPGASHAACTQAQLAGTWAADSIGSSAFQFIEGANCAIDIDTTGKITSASRCAFTPAYTTGLPISGTIKLSSGPNCAYKGTIKIPFNGDTYQIVRLTLATSKTTGSAVGIYGDSGDGPDAQSPFLMTFTKIK